MFCQQIKTLFLPASQAKTVMVKDRTIQFFSSQYSSRHHLRTQVLKSSSFFVLFKVICFICKGFMFLQKEKCYSLLHQKNWQSESCMLDFVLPWHNDSQCENAGLSPTILPHQKNWDRIAHVLTKYLNTALISGLSWHSSPHIWVPTSGSYQKVLRILKRRKKPFFSMFAIFAE